MSAQKIELPARPQGRPSTVSPGDRFGRLVVVCAERRTPRGAVLWRCECDCGRECIVRADNLRSGRSASCGCASAERARRRLSDASAQDGSRAGIRNAAVAEMARCMHSPSRYTHYGVGGRSLLAAMAQAADGAPLPRIPAASLDACRVYARGERLPDRAEGLAEACRAYLAEYEGGAET